MSFIFDASIDFARSKDASDLLSAYRAQFHIPQVAGRDAIYLCGNSLGLQPKSYKSLAQQEMDDWARYGVEGHFLAKNPWFGYHHLFSERLAAVVGAKKDEVVVMNTLTVNLHLLMISFYRPLAGRYKILMEAGAFPSDQYTVETQVRMHGYDPADAIIEVAPRPGEHLINEEDVIAAIEKAGGNLALVMIGGMNYYTGQFFDLEAITQAAHKVGANAGYDLAHAAGNMPLSLHDWGVDFACWCSYKYMNAGPGAVGGVFVHKKHTQNPAIFRLGGWWGNDEKTRFKMEKGFVPQPNAGSWQMSNAPIMNMIGLNASLDIFAEVGMAAIRAKSLELTAYMQYLLDEIKHLPFTVITPREPQKRGCQLSLLFEERGREVFEALTQRGVIADWREPNVIRIAPVPLYNSFEDCHTFFEVLQRI